MPKAVNHSGFYDKHNCPQRDSIPGPRALQSGILLRSGLESSTYNVGNENAVLSADDAEAETLTWSFHQVGSDYVVDFIIVSDQFITQNDQLDDGRSLTQDADCVVVIDTVKTLATNLKVPHTASQQHTHR